MRKKTTKRPKGVYVDQDIWKAARDKKIKISQHLTNLLRFLTEDRKAKLNLAFRNCFVCKNKFPKKDLLRADDISSITTHYFLCEGCMQKEFGLKRTKSLKGKTTRILEHYKYENYKASSPEKILLNSIQKENAMVRLGAAPFSSTSISKYKPIKNTTNALMKSSLWIYELLLKNPLISFKTEPGVLKYSTGEFSNIQLDISTM